MFTDFTNGFDEPKIISEIQKGNFEQFGVLYDQYLKPIYNFVYFRTHHKPTAEDITSLVFTKALENITSFSNSRGKFSSWLYQIARNAVIDHYRSFKETGNMEDAWDLGSNENIERDTEAKMNLEKVSKYLVGLPKLQREIVIMRVWDGLSHKEIAEILNISEANSKVTFSRVVAKMEKEAVVALICLIALQI